jgi:hypothetical protein
MDCDFTCDIYDIIGIDIWVVDKRENIGLMSIY